MRSPTDNYLPVPPIIPDILAHWSRFKDASVRPIEIGLINRTLEVHTAQERAILQRINPIFPAIVHLDIATITSHLMRRGVCTPILLPTDNDSLWVEQEGVWRMLSFIPGQTQIAITNLRMAEEAGFLVGRFHAALDNLEHQYNVVRAHVHDTESHLKRLETSLNTHHHHRLHAAVNALGEKLLAESNTLSKFNALPLRHAHGDLKISNLMFDGQGRGMAIVDLDTLCRMQWPLEMGDALRSWCNPLSEDQSSANLDLNILCAAVKGYQQATNTLITDAEWDALIPGLARICLELSARFLTDALNEHYFGWDAARYPARGEHNLARGIAMWNLYQDVKVKYEPAHILVQRVRKRQLDV